jgi:Pyruvate/2-oxoacid:ferredoxin oxidoreductase delta subunit/flavodoxin
MMDKPIDFYYFSGTGNTHLVVQRMGEVFKDHDISVKLFKIEDSRPEDVNPEHIIGLGFPVAELSTYDFVWKFIKSLPPASGTEIFMVDTLAGFSGGIVGPVREIVKNKGYDPIGACEIIMPPNIFYIEDDKTSKKKVKKGIKKAGKYAEALIKGKTKWGRVPLLSDAVYYTSLIGLKFTETKLNQRLLHLKTDGKKCSKCQICYKLCPINNIQLNEDGSPKHLNQCQYCLRCTSFCPKGAIPCPVNYKGKTYRAVKAKELLPDHE